MIDIKLLRDDIEQVSKALKTRGYDLDIDKFEDLDKKRAYLQQQTQELQERRNANAKKIGMLKAKKQDVTEVLKEVNNLGYRLKNSENEFKNIQAELNDFMALMPNIPTVDTPVGTSEDDNVEIRKWGQPRSFDFTIKDHVDVGENLGGMDFKTATKITGSRFVVMRNEVARLHRALIQFMLDTHIEQHDYQEIYVPYLVNNDSLFGSGQLPKFSEDLFNIQGESSYSLIPTAEVPLTNIVRNEIVSGESLPLKFVAHTPCFRSEAGSYGRDTRGMIRQHQFEKVEMVQIVAPDQGLEALESMTANAETILRKLNLPYRVLQLCTADMSDTSRKTYDLEVWVPSQNTYREISSLSWCGDFQARRMKARYKNKQMKKPDFVHTLNGSGLAVGRTLVAILENYQQDDGSVIVPEVLRKYMHGIEKIEV